MSEHSPLPWTAEWVRRVDGGLDLYIEAGDGAAWKMPLDYEESEANVAFIVKAVNNHNKLVDALGLAASLLGCGDAYDDFEDLADLFYQDTGYMRPGKSDVRYVHTDEERNERFMEWVAGKKRDIATVLAALKDQP